MTPGQAAYLKARDLYNWNRVTADWDKASDEIKEMWEEIAMVAINVWHHRLPDFRIERKSE